MAIAELLDHNSGGIIRPGDRKKLFLPDEQTKWPSSILCCGKLYVWGGKYTHRPDGSDCFYMQSTPMWVDPDRLAASMDHVRAEDVKSALSRSNALAEMFVKSVIGEEVASAAP